MLEIYLEANVKHGSGYQVRIDKERGGSDPNLAGSGKNVVSTVLDKHPYTLYEAVHAARMVLNKINKKDGSGHELYEVLWLTQDGVEANAGRDIASARLARELRSGMRKYVELKDALEGGSDDEVT